MKPKLPNAGLVRIKPEAQELILQRAAKLSEERGLARPMPVGAYLEEASAFFEAHRKRLRYAG
jgi:hypothetical protein